MGKNIALFFDGTWNTPGNHQDVDKGQSTNVFRLHEAVAAADAQGKPQVKWYEPGVGTKWYNRIRGGAFGTGLSEKIQEGYEVLAKAYSDGDQVFIFGFSRGAYSARSLVGMIRNCGLLRPGNLSQLKAAYELYRTRDGSADTQNAVFFRNKYSREIPIHFLGVWDTVGALGIPVESFEWFNKAKYEFHDTELSGIVRNAFQALAIDEHRKLYNATLWDPLEKPQQTLEQVWFAGAHSNIGGGYQGDLLCDIALGWMAGKAKQCGLALNPNSLPVVPNPPGFTTLRDSYAEFLKGAYSRIEPRHFRALGTTPHGQESVDPTVATFLKDGLLRYRPQNKVGEHLAGPYTPGRRLS